MLRVAVEFADTWNSWGGRVATEEEAFRRTVDRGHRLDDLCADMGRDPASIARSFLVFESSGAYEVTPPTRAFSSAEGFRDLVGRYAEIGMTELIFYFPEAKDQQLVMEDVANLLPELRG